MHSSRQGFLLKISTLTLVLLLVSLWLLLCGYQGLTGDAQIYAFQALARIHPQLSTDLYLQNRSQDQFTIFSPFYARLISRFGLEYAAGGLTLLFTTWLMAATWSAVRAITSREVAWLAVAFLLIVAGDYGGAGVFHLAEPYLTARLPAEALIATAFACHSYGKTRMGFLLASAALLIHPLIALPGLLLLICLSATNRVMLWGAAAGILAALSLAVAATVLPALHVFAVMDPTWAGIVRERSQFLFLQLWSFRDWDVNTRSFIYLGFTAVAVPDERLRKLCAAAALVGASGLAVALIASLIGPVAILVQGQAWRWVWVTVFISALLLPATVLQVWQDKKCGPLCTILLVSGWTLSAVDGTACVSLALLCWVLRTRIGDQATTYCRWLAVAFGVAIGAWILTKSWMLVSTPPAPSVVDTSSAARIRDIFALRISAALFGALIWWVIRVRRSSIWVPASLSAALLVFSILILPAAFKQARSFGSVLDIGEFTDWANVIPPTGTVLVAPTRDAGAFVWFTLRRPNYLAIDQSAGVVFSRETSLEVQRRSIVLTPLMEPNWKILSSLEAASPGKRQAEPALRPLTAQILTQVCADPQLGFVIAPENVGFHPVRHDHAGPWKDWNLYDCRNARPASPAT